MSTPVIKLIYSGADSIEESKEVLACFFCPGCQRQHPYRIKGNDADTWDWNRNLVYPTFSPSLLVNAHRPDGRCHLFVRDGRLEFLNDCHHHLAGKVVAMIPLDRCGDSFGPLEEKSS